MPRPVHFEIHADNPDRAIRFYSELFDWKFQRWGEQPYWLITTGSRDEPGIDGGLVPRQGPAPTQGLPVNAFPCTIEVACLDEYIARVQSLGGSVAVPKLAVASVGWLAYFHDTEGNIFGLMQPDAGAR